MDQVDTAEPQVLPEQAPVADVPQANAGEQAEAQAPQETQEQRRYAAAAARAAKLERELRRITQQSKQREAELAELSQLKQRLDTDPFALLEERGVGYDKWTQRILQGRGQQPQDPTEELRTKLAALEGKLTEKEQAEQQSVQQREEAQLREQMRTAVEAHPALPYVATLGHSDLVLSAIRQHAAEYGDCPPDEQERIATRIESTVRDQVTQQIRQLAKVDGFRQLLQSLLTEGSSDTPEPDQRATNGQQAATATKPKPRTLTNGQAASVASRGGNARTDDERKRAALDRLAQLTARR
jgi:hypothetical protein